jgi:formate dehydrogenase iron-sulfur subunit
MTASATVWSRPAPRHVQPSPSTSVDGLREQARKRVEELHQRGVPRAYLYGDAPSETYSELHSFYLLVDRPSVYGLPEDPFNPWLHMMGDYVRSVAGGLAAIAALLVVVFLLKP